MTSHQTLHLAIIPDGNRRWARGRGLLPWNGHERAVENFRSLLQWCADHPRISTLTIWGFSTENWKRSPEEVDKLMKLYETYLRNEQEEFAQKGVRFVHSGRTDRIPVSLRKMIEETTAMTAQGTSFTMHLAIDYGGKDEVVRAVRKMSQADITETSIREHLDHPELPDIDLIIRTSGEQRTSNFFLWQSAYAEWIFLPQHFPSLTTDDLAAAIEEFDQRKRRFGA